jgi:hypothetical protein
MPCILCSGNTLTNEHAFPQWLRKVIPGEDELIRHRWIAPDENESTREWTHVELDFKTKAICRNCNVGWMKNLEDSAKPYLTSMIQGRGRNLYEIGKLIIAYWVLKTIMMIDLAQEDRYQSIPLEDYLELFKAKGVLPNTYIWLAANSFGEGALARIRRLNLNETDKIGYGATINIGHFVAHLVRVPIEDGKTLEIGGPLMNALVPHWPRDEIVVWPPSILLDQQQVAFLGGMISASPVSVI